MNFLLGCPISGSLTSLRLSPAPKTFPVVYVALTVLRSKSLCATAISLRFADSDHGRLGSRVKPASHKPLSALISQVLVAYTVEIDCEFERRILQTQSRSARLSLTIWLNALQFLAHGPVSLRTLASRALTTEAFTKSVLGCLERWGVVALQPGKRAGFGSGRGIRADWPVRLTADGERAAGIWPDLIPEIDARWLKRFGDDPTRLRRSLEAIEHQIDLELPPGLPVAVLKLPEFGSWKSPPENRIGPAGSAFTSSARVRARF